MESNHGLGSDEDLIEAFLKDRTERNFLEIYRRHATPLYRLALHFVRYDEASACDIVQETWVVAVRKLGDFQRRSSLRTWLTGILLNKCKEYVRQNSRYSQEIPEATDRGMESQGMKLDLQNAINHLSPGYREILVLHDAEGYKHREIADLLGISEGTSKSQLFHARNQVKKFLADHV